MPTVLEVFVTIKVLGERVGVALLLTSDKANKKPKQIYHDISWYITWTIEQLILFYLPHAQLMQRPCARATWRGAHREGGGRRGCLLEVCVITINDNNNWSWSGNRNWNRTMAKVASGALRGRREKVHKQFIGEFVDVLRCSISCQYDIFKVV